MVGKREQLFQKKAKMEAALRLPHRHSPPHHLAASATTTLLVHTLLVRYDDRFCPDRLFLAHDTSVCCVRRCSDIRSRPTRFDARRCCCSPSQRGWLRIFCLPPHTRRSALSGYGREDAHDFSCVARQPSSMWVRDAQYRPRCARSAVQGLQEAVKASTYARLASIWPHQHHASFRKLPGALRRQTRLSITKLHF